MIEAGVVLDPDGIPFYWHLPVERSMSHMSDSRDLWEVFWEHRNIIGSFAHSHPGSGIPSPSPTDLTTFAAVEAGLGIRIDWHIISSDHTVVLRWHGPERLDYAKYRVYNEPEWAKELREISV